MIVLILFTVIASIVFYFRNKPQIFHSLTTAKEAYRAYYAKYDLISNPKHYNRVAFRLIDDTPMFLDDSPYTSAYFYPAERETLTDDDEVYCMIVVQTGLFGYVSHDHKKAKKAIILLFHPEPFRELGRFGTGLKLSWRVDDENYHVLDDNFMKCNELEDFVNQVAGEYELDES